MPEKLSREIQERGDESKEIGQETPDEMKAAKEAFDNVVNAAAEADALMDRMRQEFADDAEAMAELASVSSEVAATKARMVEIEAEFTREKKGDLLEGVNEGLQTAIELVRARFEDAADEKDRLPFHKADHTVEVAVRTRKILEAIRRGSPDTVDDRTIQIGQLVGAFHDTVQKWVPNEDNMGPDGSKRIMRKRLQTPADPTKNANPDGYKGNETASADEAKAFIDDFNRKRKEDGLPEVFTEEDKLVAERAIDHTVPQFEFAKKTVVQPRLTQESDIISRAVALADLGEAGMDPKGFEKAGDLLFREDNLDILDASKDLNKLDAQTKEQYRKRMLGWSKFQESFANGRRAELDKELEGLPEAAAAEVKKLFDKFDESIKLAAAKAARRENMTVEELIKDMGYEADRPAGDEGMDKAA